MPRGGFPTTKADPYPQYAVLEGGKSMRKLKLKGLTTTERGSLNLSSTDRAIIYNNTNSHFEQWDGTSWLSLGGISFPGSVVFSGTSPTVETELDLSSTVGANSALVFLLIYCPQEDPAGTWITFKKYGETVTHNQDYTVALGTAGANQYTSKFTYLMAVTDSGGKLKWIASDAVASTTITLEAYIK